MLDWSGSGRSHCSPMAALRDWIWIGRPGIYNVYSLLHCIYNYRACNVIGRS